MKVVSEPLIFDWDKGNLDKNLKHGVGNVEAEEVFVNEPLFVNLDVKHSRVEPRLQALGKTVQRRLLFVSFTKRGNKIRIISARDMSKRERIMYEKT